MHGRNGVGIGGKGQYVWTLSTYSNVDQIQRATQVIGAIPA